MPRTLQNPNSWLHTARVRAGYKTVRSLAERLGVALSQVVEWGRGPQRPMWQHIPKLAEAFGLAIPEVITGLWRESLGDPCPCGCGGRKIPPDNPAARKLLIEIPCVNCGTTRTRIQGNWRFHVDLCPKCAWGAVEFRCVGFDDHGRHDWAKTCPYPHKVLLLPSAIRKHQKAQKPAHGPFKLQPRFIDESQRTLRCWRCAHAAMIIAVTENRIKDALAEKYPSRNVERIKSQSKRLAMLSGNIREINPAFVKAGGAAAPKNPHRSEVARRSLARSNVVNGWSKKLPSSIRMGMCLVCGKLTFETKRPAKFHRRCYLAWLRSPNGRSFQQLLGMGRMEAELLPRKMGRAVDENQLKTRYSWAIQSRLGEKSYRQIAKENNVADFTIVRDGIEFVIEKLPASDLVASRFQRTIQLLLDALRDTSIGVSNG